MEELLQRFHARRAALLAPTGKRPNRYPDELREIAIAYSKEAKAQGVRQRVAAERLGIDPVTLAAWGHSKRVKADPGPSPATPKLRRVEVVDVATSAMEAGGLCVLGPRGLRVEGMSVEQIAVLFERLAC